MRDTAAGAEVPAPFATLARRRRAARLGHTVLWQPVVDSTNTWARRLAAARRAPEGVVLVADGQQEGRGRHGRRWESPSGLGLYCSIVARPRLPAGRLGMVTLAAGIAAAAAVRRLARVPAVLQWPNDLLARGRKLGGILVETSTTGGGAAAAPVVIGWGLNLGQSHEDFPVALRRSATSLRLEDGRTASRAALVGAFLSALEPLLAMLEAGEARPVLRRFARLAPGCEGAPVVIELGGRRRRAVSRGLDEDGSLHVELPEGKRILRSADLLRVLRTRPCSWP